MTLQSKHILPKGILAKAELAIFELFKAQQDGRLVFHNYEFTSKLVDAVQSIGTGLSLNPQNLEMLTIAGWFLPTGALTDYDNPTEAAVNNVANFLAEEEYPRAKSEKIKDYIRLIGAGKIPVSEEQEVFHDAYYSVFYGVDFMRKSSLLQLEEELFQKTVLPKDQWVQLQLQKLLQIRFYTTYGKLNFESEQANNILALKNQLLKFRRKKQTYIQEVPEPFQDIEEKIPERGIQTFFRTNYRNHINLSAIADNKANIMISVNAILLSVLISLMTYKNIAETKPMILMAVLIFFVTGLTSLVFAVLSARPKVTSFAGKMKDKNTMLKNIVFFGNFVHLDIDQYEEAMDQIFRNGDLMYGNMVRDLYYLGKVLDKKYRYLTTSYNIFMVGFIATSITLLIALMIN